MRPHAHTQRVAATASTMSLLLALLPVPAVAAPVYLPGITSEMGYASYWASKRSDPNTPLATVDAILARNRNAAAAKGNNLIDLKSQPQTFDAVSACEALARSAEADAGYYVGWTYDVNGHPLTMASFAERVANTADPAASEQQPARYAVVTRDSFVSAFASDEPILDDPSDPDFDYNYLERLRVGEPLYVRTTSADGRWVSVYASCLTGWVPVDDIAFAESRDEWLAAWDFAPEETLVVYGESVRTEDSRTYPATARVEPARLRERRGGRHGQNRQNQELLRVRLHHVPFPFTSSFPWARRLPRLRRPSDRRRSARSCLSARPCSCCLGRRCRCPARPSWRPPTC